MAGDGLLRIAAQAEKLERPRRVAGQDLDPGAYCRIDVIDTGAGIPDAIRERMFEPFFTTKEKGKGTGLGLSVALGIAQSHKGAIDVRNNAHEGATVSLFLPLGAPVRERQEAGPDPRHAAQTDKAILVVDDEEDYLAMIADCLEMEGYRVLSVSSGSGAVDLFRRRHGEVGAVLLDMIMPGMGGVQTFRTLRRIDPHARVIICSGFSREGKATQLLNDGAAAFLQKPFNLDELRRCLAAVLADADA